MRKKYYFNEDSCRFERLGSSIWKRLLVVTLVGSVLATSYLLGINFRELPGRLTADGSENRPDGDVESHFEELKSQVREFQAELSAVQSNDDNIYRMIFGVQPLSKEVRSAGSGGASSSGSSLNPDLPFATIIEGLYHDLEVLKRKTLVQQQSFQELEDLAIVREDRLTSIPAMRPVKGTALTQLTSGFGMRIDPFTKLRKPHLGVDFSVPTNSEVVATGNGVIVKASHSIRSYGNLVEIDHGHGYVTRYAHLNSYTVKVGQKVKRGERVGYSGNTGKSTAPHLHYEVHFNSDPVNPVFYFGNDLTPAQFEKIQRIASVENQALGVL